MSEQGHPPTPHRTRRSDDAAASPPDRRTRELSSLNAIAEVLNRTTDLSEALTRTLTLVAEVLGLHSGWVWLLDEAGQFVPAATYHLPPHLQRPENMSGWPCLCLRTFVEGDLRGAANVNVLSCSRLSDVVDGTDGLRFHASVPMYVGGRRIGVMNVAMPQWRELAPEELQFLYTVGYQVGLAVEHTRLLETRTRLAQTEERNRLAREIHDTVAQTLAGLVLQLETVDVLMDRDPERAATVARGATGLARHALDDVRRSVMDLRAAPLEGLTLAEALRRFGARFERDHGLKADVVSTGPDRALPPRVEMAAFRVAQEALANAARHAHAGRVIVQLDAGQSRSGTLLLRVEDDGRGFDGAPPPGHFGLTGMSERARLAGGALEVASAAGTGTRITLELPLDG
jgi:two-component system NarL family sensor kinase